MREFGKTKPSKSLAWVYLLPTVHLLACLAVLLTYVVPALQNVEGWWEPIIMADSPISVVGVGLAFSHQVLACVWFTVAGTAWWYLLSVAAFKLVGLFKK